MTSTIYHSIASCKLIDTCFDHTRGRLSRNSSANIAELMTSCCSISQTVRTNNLVDHGALPLRAEMKWSQSSLLIPAVHYTVNCPSLTLIWLYSHPIACCVLFLLLSVLRMSFKCTSSEIFLVAALAALRWTNLCLHSCCVLESDVLGVPPFPLPGSVPFSPGWADSVPGIRWCWIGEEDDNEKKWQVLRNIYFATSHNEITNSQVARFTHVKSCCVWLLIAGVSDHSAICNYEVRCCLFVYKN